MMAYGSRWTVWASALAPFLWSCGPGAAPPSPSPPGEAVIPPDSSRLVPPGFGTLLQDDITLRLQDGDLLIKVTPLEEWVIRLTAPDTYARLHGLAQTHRDRATRGRAEDEASLFLVSLFSYHPDVTYEPEDLLLVNRGFRYRPLGISPVTPSWGTQRLGQQETRIAVYGFEGRMELETELVVEYQALRNEVWRDRILPLLRAELPRARARAGGGSGGRLP